MQFGQMAFRDMTDEELRAVVAEPWPPENCGPGYMDFTGSMTRSNAASAEAELQRRAMQE